MKSLGIDNQATGERIRHLREDVLDISQEAFGKRLDVSRGAVGNWELGKGIKRENLQRITKEFGASFEWLATAGGTPPIAGEFNTDAPEPRARAPEPGDIPNFTIHAGMGPGGALSVTKNDEGEIYSEQSDGFWRFPDAVKAGWRKMPQVYSMPVTGDSMEPTLANGSFVFVDTSHTVPSPEDIYALDYGDGLMIKRVKMVPRTDKILIMSDNPRYGTDELKRVDVRVYGRVVAWFQWRG